MKSINHGNINTENLPYHIFNNVDKYTEGSNEDKYLVFAFRDKNKEVLKKHIKLWNEIKNQIKTINGDEPIEYKKDFMKIRFESDDDLPLGKILSILGMVIVVGYFLQEDNKYYPKVCLHECVYKLWVSYKEYAAFVQ